MILCDRAAVSVIETDTQVRSLAGHPNVKSYGGVPPSHAKDISPPVGASSVGSFTSAVRLKRSVERVVLQHPPSTNTFEVSFIILRDNSSPSHVV